MEALALPVLATTRGVMGVPSWSLLADPASNGGCAIAFGTLLMLGSVCRLCIMAEVMIGSVSMVTRTRAMHQSTPKEFMLSEATPLILSQIQDRKSLSIRKGELID